MTAFWLLRGFGTGLISQASHLLTFAISGVGHDLILQLRENVRPSTLGLSELGGPKMPSHFFPIATLGVDQLPILQNSKSETPDLSDLCLDHEKGSRFLVFFPQQL